MERGESGEREEESRVQSASSRRRLVHTIPQLSFQPLPSLFLGLTALTLLRRANDDARAAAAVKGEGNSFDSSLSTCHSPHSGRGTAQTGMQAGRQTLFPSLEWGKTHGFQAEGIISPPLTPETPIQLVLERAVASTVSSPIPSPSLVLTLPSLSPPLAIPDKRDHVVVIGGG